VQLVDIGANLKILKLADLGFRKLEDIIEPDEPKKLKKKSAKDKNPNNKVTKKAKTPLVNTIPKTRKPKRRKDNDDDILFIPVNEDDEPPIGLLKPRKEGEDSENGYEDIEELALFAGITGVDEILYEEVEYQEDLDNLHPAEVAARYQSSQ